MVETPERISSVVEAVREHARRAPGRVAVNFNGAQLTFAEIDWRSDQVANGLRDADVRRGSRVGILAKNTPTFYEIALGAAKARAALVPVNYRLAPSEMAYVLGDANVEVLFVATDYIDVLDQFRDTLSDLRQVVIIDGPEYPNTEYTAWRDNYAGGGSQPISPDDVIIQAYSSGTTGRPKGIPLTNFNIWEALKARLEAWGPWAEDDVTHVCMPQYHLGAIMWGLGGLVQGAESVLTRDFKAFDVMKLVERHRITKTQLATAMMKMVMDDPGETADISTLQYIVYGGSSSTSDVVKRAEDFFGCGLAQGYGMTESSGSISYMTPANHAIATLERRKSAGLALSGVDIRISGPDDTFLPPGQIGEVVCRGPQVMEGYWKLPEATSEVLRGGWLHSGDAGYMDTDGYLYIVDRIKDMIVSGGENIYSAEVESAVSSHPAVKDTAVIGVPDERWGEVPKAFVVADPAILVTESEIIDFVRDRIAHYKSPKSVEFVDILPRNASGKILKRELRAQFEDRK